jgi:hypothetical protein
MPIRTSMQMADMEINGLGCGSASRGVCSALNCIHGVARVRMLPDQPCVTVIYDAYRVSPQQFETAVRVMGCEVEHLIVRSAEAPGENQVTPAEACLLPVIRSGATQA